MITLSKQIVLSRLFFTYIDKKGIVPEYVQKALYPRNPATYLQWITEQAGRLFYRIFLSHTIGAQGLGIFQLTVPRSFCLCPCVLLESRQEFPVLPLLPKHKITAIKKETTLSAVQFFLCAVCYSGLSALFLRRFLGKRNIKRPETLGLLRLLAFSLPPATLHVCINSYYFGIKKPGFHLPSSSWNSFPELAAVISYIGSFSHRTVL